MMPEHITLTTHNHIYLVLPLDILYCKSDNTSTTFYLLDASSIVISKGMKAVCEVLEKYEFIRPHQSYLVNKHHIIRIDKLKEMVLVLKNQKVIPVSTRRRKFILENLKIGKP